MRALTYYVAASVDGYIAGPDGQFDFFAFDGELATWIVDEYPETLPVHARAALGLTDRPNRQFDTVLMGRRTYEPALDAGIASPYPYPHLRQLVFSRSVTSDTTEVEVAVDPINVVQQLKQSDGAGIWLAGGGQLAGQLRGEIDELVIKRNPVVIGAGVPLFAGPFATQSFDLVSTTSFEDGVVVEKYLRGAS